MEIHTLAGETFDATLSGAATGLATVGAKIVDDDDGATIVSRVAATELVGGSGIYRVTLTAPVVAGSYVILWDTGSITPATVATDLLIVGATSTFTPPPASPGEIITLAEIRILRGTKPTDHRDDDKLSALIPAATRAILTYTGRDFTTNPPVAEVRSFEYDGSGYLDIDDAVEITGVTIKVPHGTDYVMDADEWYGQPARRDDAPVYSYIALPGWSGIGASPEMGFTRNVDVLAREGRWRSKPTTAEVDAEWGWPEVPADVKLAAKWIIDDWFARPSGEQLTSEAIEGYSRAFGGRSGEMLALAIPNRVRDLLSAYARVNV